MSYTHYGKQAEVWKHLALCAIINQERPSIYVETNAAYAAYSLSRTPEQEYGIYLFLEKARLHDDEQNSMLCTPGVLGSGLLTTNLSQLSRDLIMRSCSLLTEFYQNAAYREFDGALFKEVIM